MAGFQEEIANANKRIEELLEGKDKSLTPHKRLFMIVNLERHKEWLQRQIINFDAAFND